jgi:ubiquinone/menaquinone biosynthesis C-methylase UbiE
VAVARLYDRLATTWGTDAGRVYGPLAASLVRASPVALPGKVVLDLGSGTGVVARAATAAGATVVAADCSFPMLAGGSGRGWSAVVAEALTLPFGNDSFDVVTAGFLLNHLLPAPALAELARVVRSGGAVMASTWSVERPDPVKTAIDGVLVAWGWEPPGWYTRMKTEVDPVSGHPRPLEDAAAEAGLVEARSRVVDEDVGVRDPGDVVAFRLAMPHIAPWFGQLDGRSGSELIRRLRIAAAPSVPGWRPSVIQLTARVAPHPR